MRSASSGIGAALAAMLLLAGCGVLPDRQSGCEKPEPYQSADETPPLKVPAGADLPDTRNALKIPEVRAPERPPERGRCLDFPPAYGGSRPAQG